MVTRILFSAIFTTTSIVGVNYQELNLDSIIPKIRRNSPAFDNYRKEANLYLNRPIFRGTPMTGDLLATHAFAAYRKWGVLVPVELALAQAQLETKMGTGGRAGHRTNPFNLGEWQDQTTITYKTIDEGIGAYYNLLARRYLVNGKTVEDLFVQFIDKDGFYYGLPDYGQEIKKHVYFVRDWIDRNSG